MAKKRIMPKDFEDFFNNPVKKSAVGEPIKVEFDEFLDTPVKTSRTIKTPSTTIEPTTTPTPNLISGLFRDTPKIGVGPFKNKVTQTLKAPDVKLESPATFKSSQRPGINLPPYGGKITEEYVNRILQGVPEIQATKAEPAHFDIEAELKKYNLPSRQELEQRNLNPEYIAKNPTLGKVLTSLGKLHEKQEKWEKETTPGKMEARAAERAAQVAVGKQAELPTTGNKILDFAADMVGTMVGFSTPGGVGQMASGIGSGIATAVSPKVASSVSALASKLPPGIISVGTKALDKLPGIIKTAAPSLHDVIRAIAGGAAYGSTKEAKDFTETIKNSIEEATMFFLSEAIIGGTYRVAKPHMNRAWLRAKGYREVGAPYGYKTGLWQKGYGTDNPQNVFVGEPLTREMADARFGFFLEKGGNKYLTENPKVTEALLGGHLNINLENMKRIAEGKGPLTFESSKKIIPKSFVPVEQQQKILESGPLGKYFENIKAMTQQPGIRQEVKLEMPEIIQGIFGDVTPTALTKSMISKDRDVEKEEARDELKKAVAGRLMSLDEAFKVLDAIEDKNLYNKSDVVAVRTVLDEAIPLQMELDKEGEGNEILIDFSELIRDMEGKSPTEPAVSDALKDPTSSIVGKLSNISDKAKTVRGTTVDVRYAIADVDDLISSHDTNLRVNTNYPQDLQPRDRTRVASEIQIEKIAKNIEPSFLGKSPKASEGAPIIGEDMIVESGNARVIALNRAYNYGTADNYKKWLIDNAENFGLNKDEILNINKPVLVRVRTSDVDRVKFVQEANEQSIASMGATEQAMVDAQKLDSSVLSLFYPAEDGNILNAENRGFISRFLSEVIGSAEQGNYIAKDGTISQDGVRRIQNAIFAKAYGDTSSIEKLAESTDSNIKNITNAMLAAAPRFVDIKEGIQQGNLFDLDISTDVAQAANKLSSLRETGMSVELYLRQASMFEDDISDLGKDLLDVFDKYKRSSKKITEILQACANAIEALGHPDQIGMFGATDVTNADILEAALRRVEGDTTQTSIFQDESGERGAGITEVAGVRGTEEYPAGTIVQKDGTKYRISGYEGGKVVLDELKADGTSAITRKVFKSQLDNYTVVTEQPGNYENIHSDLMSKMQEELNETLQYADYDHDSVEVTVNDFMARHINFELQDKLTLEQYDKIDEDLTSIADKFYKKHFPKKTEAVKEPWQMTKEEFTVNVPKGYKYIPDLGETIARYNSDGTITLTDAFFGHDEQTKKELLAHEKAHGMVKHISERASSGVFWDLVNSGLFGKYDSEAMKFNGVPYNFSNVDEILTQLVADIQLDGIPEKFKDEYAVQYNIAQQILDGKDISIRAAIEKAIAEGKPVPEEVLKDYPELQKSTEKVYGKRAKFNKSDNNSPLLDKYNYEEDEGTVSWLDNVINKAKEKIKNLPDDERTYLRETTASFENIHLNPKFVLDNVEGGLKHEEDRIDSEYARNKIKEITESIKVKGYDESYKPFINIDVNGKAWINEGNHRIRAAIEAGLNKIPFQVRYYDGGERADGIWKPDNLVQKAEGGIDEGTPETIPDRRMGMGEDTEGKLEGKGKESPKEGIRKGIDGKETAKAIVNARPNIKQSKAKNTVEEYPELKDGLMEHQAEGVNIALNALDKIGGFLLADGAGAGKTAQGLAVSHIRAKTGKKILILTERDAVIKDAWKSEAKRMFGDDKMLKPWKGSIEGDGIYIATYSKLRTKNPIPTEGWDLFIADESHNMKNWKTGTKQALAGLELIQNTKEVMFMSATPFDRLQEVYYLGVKLGTFKDFRDFEKWLKSNGIGKRERQIRTARGSITIEEYYPIVSIQKVMQNMRAYGDKLTQEGLMLKREVRMDGLDVTVKEIELPAKAYNDLNKINESYAPANKALAMMAMRRHLENYKIDEAIEIAKKELAEGRQVAIFTGYKEAATDKASEVESESAIKELRGRLEEIVGKDNVAEIHGGIKGEKKPNIDKEITAYQAGQKKVAISTMDMGSTGISLHDEEGMAPRTQIMLTLPWSALKQVQVAGRSHRLTSKSNTRLIVLTTDTEIDQRLTEILSGKMRLLGAAVQGDIKKLNIDRGEEFADVGDIVIDAIAGAEGEAEEPTVTEPVSQKPVAEAVESGGPVTLEINHSSKQKEWIAEITGTDKKYKYKREFIRPTKKDWSSSGKTGTTTFELEEGKVYDISPSYKRRYFAKVENGQIVKIDEGDVLSYIGEEKEVVEQLFETISRAKSSTKATAKTKTTSATEPIKQHDIINFLSEKLDIPVRTGRYRGKARGIFKVTQEVVRTKFANDVYAVSHEIGHALDKAWDLRSVKKNSKIMDEFKTLAHGVKGSPVTEGIAQFINFYITDPAYAAKVAPLFMKEFESKLGQNPEVKDILLEARRQYEAWESQSDTEKVLSMISFDKQQKRPLTLERFYTQWVDELQPLKTATENMLKGSKIPMSRHPFYRAWLNRGWMGLAEAYLHNGQMDKNFKKIGPSLDEILKPIAENEFKDFIAHITAKRAIELLDRGINPGITKEQAEGSIREITGKYSNEKISQFQHAFKQLVEYQDNLLKMLVDSGVLGKEAYKKIKLLNQDYIPFYRLIEGFEKPTRLGGKRYADVSQPIKRIKGSGRQIINPLESVIKNTYAFINIAERNTVGRLLTELTEQIEGSGKWVEKIDTPLKPTKIQLQEISGALEDAGVDTTDIDLEQLAVIFRPNVHGVKKDNIVVIHKDGKPQMYQLDPELYIAVKSLDTQSAHWLIDILSKPAAWLRAGAILTPDFPAKNIFRDQFAAFIYSKYGYIPVIDAISGLAHVLKKDDLYWKWYASGGAHGAMVSLDRDYIQNDMKKILTERTTMRRLTGLLKSPIELLGMISEISEEATRITEFKKGIQVEGINIEEDIKAAQNKVDDIQNKLKAVKNKHDRKTLRKDLTKAYDALKYLKENKDAEGYRRAALASRDLTLDFRRGGHKSRDLNRINAFFNAGIQGIDKLGRAFREDPFRTLYRIALLVTLPSLVCYAINRKNKYYEELPRWEKDIFWHTPIPGSNGKRFIRIPKPFEIGILFGTLPERFLQYVDKNDPKAFDEFNDALNEYVFQGLVPDKEFMFLPTGLIPTAFIPVIESFANKSIFTRTQTVPQSELPLSPPMQYGPSTSEVAKLLGGILDVSPRKIDNTIRGYTGGLGRNVTDLLDAIMVKTGVAEEKVKPGSKDAVDVVGKIPAIGTYISKYPLAYQSPTVNDFYNDYNEAEKLYKTAKAKVEKEGKKTSITKKEAELVKLRPAMKKVVDILSDIKKEQMRIMYTNEMTPKEKAKNLHELEMLQINIVRRVYGKEPLK